MRWWKSGADIIELGVPFSDPMADGPTIQRSSERALKHHTSLQAVLEAVSAVPCSRRRHAGRADGLCQPDRSDGLRALRAERAQRPAWMACWWSTIRPKRAASCWRSCKRRGIDSIFLLSPTTRRSAHGEGRASGQRLHLLRVAERRDRRRYPGSAARSARKIPQLRSHIKLPIGVGFGIRDAQTAQAVARISDAVVIGSRLVQEIETIRARTA